MNPKKYPSRYSNGKLVSAAQYITELICENKAKKDKLDLHFKFWNNKEWSQFYKNQIASANKLLKKYDASAIIKAIQDNKAKNIYSLRAPHLLPIIDQYEHKIHKQCTSPQADIDRSEKINFRKNINKTNNIISKLKDLDNGT